ncbi:MAG: MurR/RpiR family transcriptional regulator [Pseudomonadota bacterium]
MVATASQLHNALSKNFQELSPQLKQAARYILDNRADVATHSLRQIARRSGLTPPTFSRLARAVGFDGYENLKDVCRSELKRNSMTLAQRAFAMQDNPGDAEKGRGSFAERHAASSVENITQLIGKLDLEYLADIADKLSEAKKVILVGALSSRAILEYLHHMMSIANPGWTVMTDSQHSSSSLLSEIDDETVILVVSIQPYIRRTVQIAELTSGYGASVISITDDISSPVLKHSSHSILVPTDSPQFFPSYVAVLTLLEILTGMVVRRWGDEANKRIDSVEKTAHAIGDYI